MEFEWNLIRTEREKETIKRYFEMESYYMPSNNFYSHHHNLTIRNLAVSVIAKHWRDVEVDAFVPYLAMNYFDTLVSRYDDKPYSEIDQVPLVATACLTLAAKIREFSQDFCLEGFDPDAIEEMELRIYDELEEKTKPVTPFCFLDYFYPPFERIAGFKRQCINEIIVQAKGEDEFIEYKPSDIALHSLIAATRSANLMIGFYLVKLPEGANRRIEIDEKLLRLIWKKGIKIEPAGPNASSSSLYLCSSQGKPEEARTAKTESRTKLVPHRTGKGRGRGRGRGKVKAMEILATIVEDKEESSLHNPLSLRYCPKKQMNFTLMWPTDDPLLVQEPEEESQPVADEHIADEHVADEHIADVVGETCPCCSIG